MSDALTIIMIVVTVTALAVIVLWIGENLRSNLVDIDADLENTEQSLEELIKHVNKIELRLQDVEKNELLAKYEEIRTKLNK